jgi:ectoine hydroxylase-related dioxygenase (phytanoyl-CoA dioxygenase family)
MIQDQSAKLNAEREKEYRERGYFYPVRAFERDEAAKYCNAFLAYFRQNEEQLRDLVPRERAGFMIDTHLFLPWVYGLVSHPRVLDAVESILGPNLMVWSSQWFPKFPGDKAFVSWHQDATYWGLTPPHVTTAWIALSESVPENGCIRVVPGTHKTLNLPQRDTFARDNILSRGQEIAVEVDERGGVNVVLRPGEFSLHHVGIVHGSGANQSHKPRIGLAIRYMSTEVIQSAPEREMAVLVRGRDDFGHFEIAPPPQSDGICGQSAIHKEAMRRKKVNAISRN